MSKSGFGDSVFKKINEDGSVKHYPGNTIVMMVDESSDVYSYLRYAADCLREMGLSKNFMLLPSSSYHMTVIQGVNDQVRKETHWSTLMPLNTPLTEMNQFFEEKINETRSIGEVAMTFDKVQLSNNTLGIYLKPADSREDQKLRGYRDRISESIGVRLPGHENYSFHITLAYVWESPDMKEAERLKVYTKEMTEYFNRINENFVLTNPQFVRYENMFDFPGE